MIRRRILMASALLLLIIPARFIHSQSAGTQPERFRQQRQIFPGGPGPNRLLVDAALLAGSNASWQYRQELAGSERKAMIIGTGGLSDLRIYDGANREVPYLLIMPPSPAPKWFEVHPAPQAQTKRTSGFQINLDKALLIDRVRLNGIPAPFVKRCIVEAGVDAGSWTQVRSEATVFDVPSEKLQSLEIDFAPGNYRYLRITWDDQASARVPLPRSVSIRMVSAGMAPQPTQTPISFQRRGSEPGVSRYRLYLPGANLPITEISIAAAGGNILRQAKITEGRLEGNEIVPHELGAAMLRREIHGELSAAEMSISITPPREAQLELMIDDGNNLPLEITGISASFAYLPWIYFESQDKAPLTARYGYPELQAPRYDLEAARTSAAKARTAEAHWGEARHARLAPPLPSGNGLPESGSTIDLQNFRYARRIAAGKDGLNSLALDAAVVAHSKMTDLRIATDDGHQIPYILEKAAEPLSLQLPALEKMEDPRPQISGLKTGGGSHSCYRVRLPYPNLPPARLVVATTARVFQRNIQVLIERNPFDERQPSWSAIIAQQVWSHTEPESEARALVLEIPPVDTTEAMIVVDEGDNSPLPITTASVLLPSYRVRFFRNANTNLTLYYGCDDLDAPQYDLMILAPRLTGAPAEEIAMAPEHTTTAVSARPRSLWLFWGILVAAVVALLILIVRLVRKTGGGAEKSN